MRALWFRPLGAVFFRCTRRMKPEKSMKHVAKSPQKSARKRMRGHEASNAKELFFWISLKHRFLCRGRHKSHLQSHRGRQKSPTDNSGFRQYSHELCCSSTQTCFRTGRKSYIFAGCKVLVRLCTFHRNSSACRALLDTLLLRSQTRFVSVRTLKPRGVSKASNRTLMRRPF